MADNDDRLAIVVGKPRAQTAIDACQDAGVYDPGRSVTPRGEDAVTIPVTRVPEAVPYREVVRQVGEPRLRGLAEHLCERGWTDAEIERAPGSWAVVGSVVLVEMGEAPRPGEVGEALLAIHGQADTVLARNGIDGDHREPDVEVVAGEGDTRTVQTEHGVEYGLDLAEVMFSPGNKAERARMGRVASDRASGERVLDAFAGIGYFTLPMARAGAHVIAIERNPTAFRFLTENVVRNGVRERVSAYRADCRDVLAEGLDAFGDAPDVDRIVMGYYDATDPDRGYLDPAIGALAPGGVAHVHEATPEALVFERPIERIEAAAAARDRSVEVLDTRRVKSYSEGVAHVVVDARVE